MSGRAADIHDITNLVHLYPELLDAGRFEELGQLFAHGEVWSYRFGNPTPYVAAGAEAVRRFYSGFRLYDGVPMTRHCVTNLIVEVDPAEETATARSYFIVLQALADFPLQIIASGRYHDSFTKEDGRWRFTRKKIYPDFIQDISRHATGPAAEGAHGPWERTFPS